MLCLYKLKHDSKKKRLNNLLKLLFLLEIKIFFYLNIPRQNQSNSLYYSRISNSNNEVIVYRVMMYAN